MHIAQPGWLKMLRIGSRMVTKGLACAFSPVVSEPQHNSAADKNVMVV
jgi:hypothetical protein